MPRRLPGWLALAMLAGCGPGTSNAQSSPPTQAVGLVVITTGGTALTDGATDVPTTLDLRILAGVDGVAAVLDDAALPLHSDGRAFTAQVAPMALGSAHTLAVAVPGRDTSRFGFHVVPASGVHAAVHVDAAAQRTILDVAFQLAPDQAAVTAALPPGAAAATWTDGRHLRAVWAGTPPPTALHLPPTITAERGSHLAGAVDLDLTPPAAGTLRSVTVPAPGAGPAAPLVVAFSVATQASRDSIAAHAPQISILSPTGITVGADGSLIGVPDTAAVAITATRGIPLWPLVQALDIQAVHSLLGAPAAIAHLVASIRSAAAANRWPGVHLDVENAAGSDRDALSSLIGDLAAGLHADSRRLAVALIPHKPGHLNLASAAYDLAATASAADLVTLMAYEEHGPSTAPGPVAGLDWDEQLLAGTLPSLAAPHTLLGLGAYARSWSQGSAIADGYGPAVATALALPGARCDYDFAAAVPFIAGSGGTDGITYYDDADSLARKLALVPAQGMAGVAVWRLGFEDPAFWRLVPAAARRL